MNNARDRLLSLTRRDLEHCWEASQYNEKSFRLRHTPRDIARMCVWRDCDIMRTEIEMGHQDGKGINLNISSQLVLGATKILGYQADDLLKETTKLLGPTTLQSRKDRRGHHDKQSKAPEAHNIDIDVPPEPRDIYFNARTDLHLMLEEVPSIPYDEEMLINFDARLDFGMLTEAEIDELLSSSTYSERLEEEVRHDETAVPDQVSYIPENVTDHHTVQFNEETSALQAPLELEVQPPQDVDPPAEVTELHSNIAIPEISTSEILPKVPEQPVFEKRVPLPRRKFPIIDKAIKLSGATIQKQIEDCRIYFDTIPVNKPPPSKELTNELFSRPGSSIPRIIGGTWGKCLIRMFKEIIALPITTQPIAPLLEAADVSPEVSADDAEVMRRIPEVTLPENVQEMSTNIPTGQEIGSNISKVAQSTMLALPSEQMPEDSCKDNDDEPNFDLPQLPDVTEATILEKDRKRSIRSIITEGDENELLKTIQLRQRKQNPIPFNQMAHELNYDREVAIDQFLNLLKIHSRGIVTLRQAGPFEEIWITLPPNSSHGSTS